MKKVLNNQVDHQRGSSMYIQPQMEVGKVDDEYEKEANDVADKVMRMPEGDQMPKMSSGSESIQMMKLDEDSIKMGGSNEGTIQMTVDSPVKIQKMSDGNKGAMPAPQKVEQGINNSKGSGQSLPAAAQADIGTKMNTDLSNVKIHTDSDSVQMNKEIGAKAFTHGNDIYFNQGQYNPQSSQGKHLLTHELTHTVQQKKGTKTSIQRHMQSSYPWEGIISGTWSAALRGKPALTDFIANLPKGTRLTVIGNSGNWLHVRVFINNIQKTGYVSQELVILSKTDIVADEMGSLVGKEATWVPSGNLNTNTFTTWAKAKSESEAPPVKSTTMINCWEMVLLSAYRTGAITWKWIHELYNKNPSDGITWGSLLPARMVSGNIHNYNITTKKPNINRGDLVFFNGAEHVALATGDGEKVYTFWPPPGKKSFSNTIDEVKIETITDLVNYMNSTWGGPTKVTFGKPIW